MGKVIRFPSHALYCVRLHLSRLEGGILLPAWKKQTATMSERGCERAARRRLQGPGSITPCLQVIFPGHLEGPSLSIYLMLEYRNAHPHNHPRAAGRVKLWRPGVLLHSFPSILFPPIPEIESLQPCCLALALWLLTAVSKA